MSKHLLSRPGSGPAGRHRVPGDKSISHRALMLAAVADDETVIDNVLHSADCLATANALRALGTDIEWLDVARIRVRSGAAFVSPEQPLDLGNSGTGMRLLAGLLCGRDVTATLTGDASLQSRPMRRIADPLNRMGAAVNTAPNGCAPLVVHGRRRLRGIDFRMPIASAQVKSAVLLAGLAANAPVIVREPAVSRDHTERMLRAFGANVRSEAGVVCLEPDARLQSPGWIEVPGDLSSAAFPIALAAMTPGASLTIENVGVNPTRAGILDLLARMGANVRLENEREYAGEPLADLTVTGNTLRGIRVSDDDVSTAIDEIPVLLAVAAIAEGETVVRGAGELRVKESDRLAAMSEGLWALGIRNDLLEDGIRVFGGQAQGGTVESRGDHRIAMSFAVLGQRAVDPVKILDSDNIETSFPGFVALMRRTGADIMESRE